MDNKTITVPTAVVPRRTVDDMYDEAFRQAPPGPASILRAIPQTGGDHYKNLGQYEPWKVMRAVLTPEEYRGYHKATVLAYLLRERAKGGDQDIQKAADHLAELANFLREQAQA